MGQLNLRVLIEAVDRASKPLRGITRGIQGMVRPAKIAGMAALSLGRDLRNMALIGVAGLTTLGFGLFRMTRGMANAAEAALRASQATGVGLVSYQRLAVAARDAGVSNEKLDASLGAVNRRIDAVRRGVKGAVDPFNRLGISLRDANGEGKTTEAVLLEIAERFKGLPGGARKAAIAAALFGDAGAELTPLLDRGADAIRRAGDEAEATGQIFSEKAARDAEAFNRGVRGLIGGLVGLRNTVGSELLPELIKLVGWLRKMIDANRPEIVRQLKAALKAVADATPGVVRGIRDIIGVLGDIARVVGPLIRAIGGFNSVLDIMAALLIGRVAAAIWAATSAVMGLNVAMWANPIGLIIAGLAALVFAGWMLYRNWKNIFAGLKVVWGLYLKYCNSVWEAIKTGFKKAMGALWEMLPSWLRMIFRGAAFTLRVIGRGLNGGGDSSGGNSPPTAPRPAAPGASTRDRRDSLDVNLILPRGMARFGPVTSTNPNHVLTTTHRGGYGD